MVKVEEEEEVSERRRGVIGVAPETGFGATANRSITLLGRSARLGGPLFHVIRFTSPWRLGDRSASRIVVLRITVRDPSYYSVNADHY